MKNNQSYIYAFSRLWEMLSSSNKSKFYILLLLVIASSFTELFTVGAIFPYLSILINPNSKFGDQIFGKIFNILQYQDNGDKILFYTCLFLAIIIISTIFRYILLWHQSNLSFSVGTDLSNKVFTSILNQSYYDHISRNSSEVISTVILKTNGLIFSVLLPIPALLSSIMMVFGILISMLLLNPFVALIMFGLIGSIYLLIFFLIKKSISNQSFLIGFEQKNSIKILQESIGGIRDVIIDNARQFYINHFTNSQRKIRKAESKVTVLGGIPRNAIEAFGMIVIILVAYTLSRNTQNIATIIPILGTIVFGAQRVIPLMQQIYSNFTNITASKVGLFEIINLFDQSINEENKKSNNFEKLNFENEITLNDISFSYKNSSKIILQNINLKIKKGVRIGIYGKTGCGKSTLLDIIMGLLDSTKGDLFIDNTRLNSVNKFKYLNLISHVPQSIFLSDTTIAENIAFGVEKDLIDYKLLHKVIELASLKETIENLERGVNTIIGERGINLSGGQRQRIGIARAIYKQKSILVLDEATSALDSETEKFIINSLENYDKNITIIIVTHRISTLENCDTILELRNSGIYRQGTFSDIFQNNS